MALIATPAFTQSVVRRSTSAVEAAQDAVFNLCPAHLANQLELRNNPKLVSRGYPTTPSTSISKNWGPVADLSAVFEDGTVQFGGSDNKKFCLVVVKGSSSAIAAETVSGNLKLFSPKVDLQSDLANSSKKPGLKIDAFAGKLDTTTVLHLFITVYEAPYPRMTSIAIYGSDK